jgi:peptide/nickel transport system permease protein/nickel transport system permease protein
MRIVEGISVRPALAVSLVVAGVLGLSLTAVIIALAAVHWTEYARVVRNVTMVERSKPYVMAAEAIGARAAASSSATCCPTSADHFWCSQPFRCRG